MANYKISNEAQADLIRIHQYGVLQYGEDVADLYYWAFFERFEYIAKQPRLYPVVDNIRQGYRRSVCGVDSIYYTINEDGVVEIISIMGRQDEQNIFGVSP